MNRETWPNQCYPLTGDVTSTAGDPKVKVTGLQGIPIATTTPTDSQVLAYVDATGLYTPVAVGSLSGLVTSVFGRTGAVVAVAGDYGPTLGGTGVTAWLKGDLLVGSGTNTTSTLAVGTDGYVLVADSAQTLGIKWVASSTIAPVTSVFGRTGAVVAVAGDYSPALGGTGVTAWSKGNLLVGTGTNTTSVLAVGTNDYVLVADSAQTTGVKWAAASSVAPVTSVFGRTGAVVAVAGDYGTTLGGTGVTAWSKGNLLAGTGTNTTAVLAAGTDGYVLVADSTQTTGIKWAVATSVSPVTSVFGRTGAVVAVAGDYGPTLGGTGQTAWVKGDILVGSGVNTTDRLAVGSNGQYVKADSTATDGLRWVDHPNVIGITIDGGITTPSTGTKGRIQVPFDCVIQSWTILTDVSGSCQFDVQKGTYSAFPTVSSIVASAPPVLSSAQKATSSTLTGWTTTITDGDILVFSLGSVSTVMNITLELKVKRS